MQVNQMFIVKHLPELCRLHVPGELFQRFQLCAEQKSMMEQRFVEQLVALGPELCFQLVVDLKACPNSEVDLSPESMQEDVQV